MALLVVSGYCTNFVALVFGQSARAGATASTRSVARMEVTADSRVKAAQAMSLPRQRAGCDFFISLNLGFSVGNGELAAIGTENLLSRGMRS